MPNDLPVHCFRFSTVFVPGKCLWLVLDTPAGFQRPPQHVVVSTPGEGRAEIEGFVETTQL